MNDHSQAHAGSLLVEGSRPKVRLCPWVNERCPPWDQLLNAHQVARLTRRSQWMLVGLSLVGRFPKRRRFHGRPVGWLRADVIDWLAKDVETAECRREAPRRCSRRHPRQACLPLECQAPCVATRRGPRQGRRDGL